MDTPQAWLLESEVEEPGFLSYDQMNDFYNPMDNFSVDSFSSENYTENTMFIDQSFQTQRQEIKPPGYQGKSSIDKISPISEPRIATSTTLPSSNVFTISFGDLDPKKEISQFSDSLVYEAAGTTKVSNITRTPVQAQDHVLAERKRREKLNRHFISLSALLPNLKKMDKATVLEDASNYIKELQNRVKELEGLSGTKRKDVQACVISMKRSRLSTSDDEHSSSDETNSGESTAPCNTAPEIEVRISGSSVLVRIQCNKNFTSLVKALTQMQKLGLSIISSNAMPFSKTNLLITIVAQIEDDCMTITELVKKLQLVL